MPRVLSPDNITTRKVALDTTIKGDISGTDSIPVLEAVGEDLEGNNIEVPLTGSDTLILDSHYVKHPSEFYISRNVGGALDELVGALPPEPPKIGEHKPWTTNTGIPDWGVLKLNDSSFFERGIEGLTTTNDPKEIYPYYLNIVPPALEGLNGFTVTGEDPKTDVVFNSGLPSGTLYGAGPGKAHSGAYTDDTEAVRTVGVLARESDIDGSTGLPERTEVVISGMVYPADRGVLALIHWPSFGSIEDFLAQDLTDRCIAAILLGQGILNSVSATEPCSDNVCDGEVGGIFTLGQTDGKYDPYAFPGRATGQYDLLELITGEDRLGDPLPEPFDVGGKREEDSPIPALGQVRLGTDPQAGDVLDFGIPILGADIEAYTPTPSDTIQSHVVLGNTVLETGSSQRPNFFAYRLPYLKDYANLKYVPSVGSDPISYVETFRYFQAYSPSTVFNTETAGNYANFEKDYFSWQIARFRHMFLMPSTADVGDPETVGSYWLVHFKKELDFEKFVRDGIMPWDATQGYSLYGASLVNSSLENVENILRQDTKDVSLYGYASESYPVLKSNIYQDPTGTAIPAITGTFSWDTFSQVMYVSGVAYFTARDPDDGNRNLYIDDIQITVDADIWKHSYYTSDEILQDHDDEPANLCHLNPVVITLPGFAYGEHSSDSGKASLDYFVGDDSTLAITDFDGNTAFPRVGRIEIPFTHCGNFTDVDAPIITDTLVTTPPGDIDSLGDSQLPSFSSNVVPRVFIRRPLNHGDIDDFAQGQALVDEGSWTLMAHTTSFDKLSLSAFYGNFANPSGSSYSILYNSTKDTYERFLDEYYRWISYVSHSDSSVEDALDGPGLQGWTGGIIDVPVRCSEDPDWSANHWVEEGYHELEIDSANETGEALQVAGLPDRNPPLSDGVVGAYPSCGILIYPQKDYTDPSIRPNVAEDGIPNAQPDYSGLLTLGNQRHYMRVFDVGFTRSAFPDINPSFTSEALLRFDGVKLKDFEYRAPGPGRLSSSGLAIFVKIPGLTTWMDVGRANGSGPSKQSPILDGAGCKVIGSDTFDGIDSQTGMVYCQVKIDVGPYAYFFENSQGEFPLMIKVAMNGSAYNYTLEQAYDEETELFSGVSDPNVPCALVRGLIGMRVVYPD